jgi:hypothetical protein
VTDDSIPRKRCRRDSECVHPDGSLLPETTEYFEFDKRTQIFHATCRCCQNYKRRLSSKRPDIAARTKARRMTREYKDSDREYQANYRLTRKRDYSDRGYWKTDKIKAYREQYRARPEYKAQVAVYSGQRRAKLLNLAVDFTLEDWRVALDYFHGCCAVCGRPQGLWHTLAQDHWIPINSSDCPGTTVSNIVPLCHGEGGCNNSKHDHNPTDWLSNRYGKRKAKQISQRIADYFAWAERLKSVTKV